MKAFLCFVLTLLSGVMLFVTPIEGKSILVEAKDYICFEHGMLDEDDVLEIIFSKPNGKAIWVNDESILEIKGKVHSNGQLEINSPAGIILEANAYIQAASLKLNAGTFIAYNGKITSAGGTVILVAPDIELFNQAKIDTSGELKGGNVFIGGGFNGLDSSVPNADSVRIAKGAVITADALMSGKGGDIVVWSDQSTTFLGIISAKGIHGGGNVEVSSKNFLLFDGFADTTASQGEQGTLLIDPDTIIIQASNPDIDGLGMGNDITSANELSNPATFPGVNSIITSGAVNSLLTGGVAMTLSATNSITVNSPISASGLVATLTLNAPTVFLNQPIDLPFGGTLNGSPSVVFVGPSGIIQNGVDVVAVNGTVNLAAATYVQELSISKNLTLNGSGIGNTTILCPATLLNNTFVFTINGATYHSIVMAEGASNVIIQNLTVDGNSQPSNFLNFRFVGIGYHNAGGTIQNTLVTNVEDSFPGGGTQHGFAIFGAIDTGSNTIQVLNNTVERFQKQGITMRGPTLTTLISGNTVIGETPVSQATMNGIVIQNNAIATISNNTISDILTATPGVDSAGILLFGAGAGTTVSENSVSNSNIGIFSFISGDNLNILQNTVSMSTTFGIFIQDTAGLTTLTGNQMSCNMTSNVGAMVEDPDTGAPIGMVFLSAVPIYNMFLVSTIGNQPFNLNNNVFDACDIGLGVQGTGVTGPVVTMNHDAFTGNPTYYIELIDNPNNIWPSTATVSFDGLVSGFITFEQFLFIQSKLLGNFQDPALGIILEFLQPFSPEPPSNFTGKIKKNRFLNESHLYLTATWTDSSSPNVIAYNIYFKAKFVKQIPATAGHIFIEECLKNKRDALQYSITAVNSMNLESTPTNIVIVTK